ncbi:MAG: hypothetical protein K0M55_15895 [Rhizobium sp.]|nr:hypothetical protein [Rhizobium sp.]MBW8322938.1 hypothetical protein [Rhizobium sp.]MBW8447930.1 hypothetical protein [Arenimonas sp.]
MTNVTALTNTVTEPADNDWIYIWDASTPANPDAKMSPSALRPAGAKVTHYYRAAGNITIPDLAAGVEGTATFTVTGAAVGDNALFNPTAALPANLAITTVYVSAANTVSVRFRNLHAADAFVTAALACVALVIRSAA